MIVNSFERTIEKFAQQFGETSTYVNCVFNEDFKIFKMHDNQLHIFEKYRDSLRLLITQPPGSGKSAIVVFNMAYRLKHYNKGHKVIICVPQTVIANTFKPVILEYPDGEQLHWDIQNNLCNGSVANGKIDSVINFLHEKDFTNKDNERVLITTHVSLANAYKNLGEHNNHVFDNTSIVVDEAHHILYSEDETNQIGNLIRDINGNNSCSLWFLTATPFRTDKQTIIPDEYKEKFDKHFLPLDQHWEENIKHIEKFEFNFAIYKENEIFDNVKEVFNKNGKMKSIIFCPYHGQLIKDSDKNQFKNQLIKNIQTFWPDCTFLDLIETENRQEKKKLLEDSQTAENIDIVLTLKIFDEGTNWVHAQQCLDLTPSDSLRIQYQRFGRLWRDKEGKNKISYFSFLPYVDDIKDLEERRKHLTDSYNSLVGSLLFQEIINPVPFPKKKNSNSINPFETTIPNVIKREEILDDVIKNLLFLKNQNEEPSKEDIKNNIDTTLTLHNVKDTEDVRDHIVKILRNRSNNKIRTNNNQQKIKPDWKEGIDLSWMKDANFDQIWDNEIFDDLLIFGTNTCGIKHFSEFRKVFDERKNIQEHIVNAEKLEHDFGIVPGFKWLENNGYTGLYYFILKYPEYFNHIKVKRSKTIQDHVADAEKLEHEFGQVPGYNWMKNNDYGTLYQCIYHYPEYFNHIKVKRSKNIQDHVADAEKLEHDFGQVPGYNWMKNNDYGRLYQCICDYPEYFKHIKVNRPKNMQDHVADAEKLEHEFNILPGYNWMRNNGYGTLYQYIYDYPEYFKHIKMNKTKTIQDHVADAEKLEHEFGGVPGHKWMKNNEYKSLYSCMHRHPEYFSHIKQTKRTTKRKEKEK